MKFLSNTFLETKRVELTLKFFQNLNLLGSESRAGFQSLKLFLMGEDIAQWHQPADCGKTGRGRA